MIRRPFRIALALALVIAIALGLAARTPAVALTATLPDGSVVSPVGFTTPVESFATAEALSPDGKYLAVLSPDAGAIDVIGTGSKGGLVDRLRASGATSLAWTTDGVYVARGYAGTIARFAYEDAKRVPKFTPRDDVRVGPGLLNGIAEDPLRHRIAVARTANHEVVTLDDATGNVTARFATSAEPYATVFVGNAIVASYFNSDRIAIWRGASLTPVEVATGPHPTTLLARGDAVYVGNADGHDVARVDVVTGAIDRRFDLALAPMTPPGQTPSGMALTPDGATLFVAESGFNDVAVIDVASGAVRARIPTGWYPTAVITQMKATTDKDAHAKLALSIVSAKGMGSQPDPGGEWNGTYTGIVQHVVVDPAMYGTWSQTVARDGRFAAVTAAAAPASTKKRSDLPPIQHVVFIVRENKHFDEEFSDVAGSNGEVSLLLYGRRFTPNAHVLAAGATLFDNFMSNGEASDWGHAWTTQSFSNDYHERNRHTREDGAAASDPRVPQSIWPLPYEGEEAAPAATMDADWFTDLAKLPAQPRTNVSGVFGPRGELVDAFERAHRSYRVYGEQLTMRADGSIAPELVAHADRDYPGMHIDFGILDTSRAKLFLDDVAAHGLAAYSYVTLPDDHTAGSRPGFYTPASFVSNNDRALGDIVAGLSARPDWKNTVVFVTCDDAQGTGDHVDSHRMPALAIGPYVRRRFVDHTRYSIPSILRTVEILNGLPPMFDAFARQPLVARYAPVAETIGLERNPGIATSFVMPIDGPEDERIRREEWTSIRGTAYANSTDGSGR